MSVPRVYISPQMHTKVNSTNCLYSGVCMVLKGTDWGQIFDCPAGKLCKRSAEGFMWGVGLEPV